MTKPESEKSDGGPWVVVEYDSQNKPCDVHLMNREDTAREMRDVCHRVDGHRATDPIPLSDAAAATKMREALVAMLEWADSLNGGDVNADGWNRGYEPIRLARAALRLARAALREEDRAEA